MNDPKWFDPRRLGAISRRHRVLALVAVLGVIGVLAHAQTNRWPLPYSQNQAIPVYVWTNAGTNGGFGSQTPVTNATNAALSAWTNVSCLDGGFSYTKFANAGTNLATDPQDSISVTSIFVISAGDPHYALFNRGATPEPSISVPLTYLGAVYACDIYFNKVDYAFDVATPTSAVAYDLQTRLMYELGHCLGLPDSLNGGSVMLNSDPGEQKRSLAVDDREAICAAYPTGGYGSPCANDTGCTGSGLHCVASALADGGLSSKYCTSGCPFVPGTANSCAPPFVCQAGAAVNGGTPFSATGACLINKDAVTQVGKACNNATDCGAGNAKCLPADMSLASQLPSNFPAWNGGYCSQDCTSLTCPAGSACYSLGGATRACLLVCRTASDCRTDYSNANGPFYACSPLAGLDAGFGACINACHSDDDCGGNAYCRTCDGVCIPRQRPAQEIGDPCSSPAECGIGQVCIRPAGRPQGVCASPCDNACSSCPNGTTCHPVGPGGETYCLRDCTEGTCNAGQQCAYVPGANGRGCEPQCVLDSDCEIGMRCSFGQCSPPETDGGACDLCFKPSGTPPPVTGVVDAGVRPPVTGGCGCEAGGGVLLLPVLFLMSSLLSRRRGSWHKPQA